MQSDPDLLRSRLLCSTVVEAPIISTTRMKRANQTTNWQV